MQEILVMREEVDKAKKKSRQAPTHLRHQDIQIANASRRIYLLSDYSGTGHEFY
jgi:hypothetical protein